MDSDPAPPPYAIAMEETYPSAPPEVTIKQPLGYDSRAPHSGGAGPSSVTAGGLRLDRSTRIGDRLIIDFEKVACCPWETVGLDPSCKDYVPQELAEKGITQAMWNEWCDELMLEQKKAPSIGGCLCIFCFPGLIPQALLCAMFCPTSGDHPLKCLPCFYGDWYVGLGNWQRKVNRELNQRDMHAKLRTYKPHQKAPRSKDYSTRIAGKDENYEMSMLEIALTVAECEKLQSESWDNGVNDGCTSGKGRIL